MKMLDMLRAMDAYVGDQDDGGAILCHACGAVVEADALAVQTGKDGQSRLAPGEGIWYCHACLMAGLRRIKALLATDDDDGAMGEDGDA